MSDQTVDLSWLDSEAAARETAWATQSATSAVTHGQSTPKPAAWLDIETHSHSGRLIVWVSGEAEMEWAAHSDLRASGRRLPPTAIGQQYYDLNGREALSACVDDFERN